jgi:hypothetical protein
MSLIRNTGTNNTAAHVGKTGAATTYTICKETRPIMLLTWKQTDVCIYLHIQQNRTGS